MRRDPDGAAARSPAHCAPMTIPPLGWLTALCALLAIAGATSVADLPWLHMAFKPAATLAIIAFAWPRGRGTPVRRRWLLAGLGMSLVGDVALMWPQGGLPGLVRFLRAHLAYLAAFTRERRLGAWPVAFVLYALVAGAVLVVLWPSVPAALRVPVAVYVVALASMAAQALVVARRAHDGTPGARRRARVLAVGGALFVLSDALLATNKFAMPLPLASLWVLSTYWAAQWCIACWLAPAGAPAPAAHMPLNRPV